MGARRSRRTEAACVRCGCGAWTVRAGRGLEAGSPCWEPKAGPRAHPVQGHGPASSAPPPVTQTFPAPRLARPAPRLPEDAVGLQKAGGGGPGGGDRGARARRTPAPPDARPPAGGGGVTQQPGSRRSGRGGWLGARSTQLPKCPTPPRTRTAGPLPAAGPGPPRGWNGYSYNEPRGLSAHWVLSAVARLLFAPTLAATVGGTNADPILQMSKLRVVVFCCSFF